MDIRPVDLDDDADLRAFSETKKRAELFERPGAPTWSERELALNLRRFDPTEQRSAFLAVDGDRVVGSAMISLPLLDNTDKASLFVTVPPEHRGRGVGTALLDFLVERVRATGRSVLLADTVYSITRREDHPYRRFAEDRGFSLGNVELVRLLDLPIPTERLDQWAREAAERHDGYKLETFVGDMPPELVEDYCYLDNQVMLDSPTGDIDFEPQGLTPEAFRLQRAKFREQGRTIYDTMALDGEGRAVAYTTIAVPADDSTYVFQWGTYVRREHRGRRLGLAVKTANLRVVQDAHPERKLVFTCNTESNAPMVDINELMGFRKYELLVEFQRKL